jgi:prophage DNA circulation protein
MTEVQAFGALALSLTADAAVVLNASYGLDGQFGRYSSPNTNPAITSETEALAAVALARANVFAAAAALVSTVALKGDVPLAVQAVLDAVGAAALSPADRMRCYIAFGQFSGSSQFALMCRRLSLVALAVAASAYQPTSYDAAQAALQQVADALDVEITAAGDAGDDASFAGLRDLRIMIAADLTARGANLAPLVTYTFAENLPDVVLAMRLYRDASRADEIVRRVEPVHPLFMPRTVQVLAS